MRFSMLTGRQHQRRKGWIGRIVGFVPFEEAEGAVQSTKPRVFLESPGCAVQGGEFGFQAVRKKEGLKRPIGAASLSGRGGR